MKIAILGWGSLIWKPKSLHYNQKIGWQKDGPMLYLEFARISKDGRLTLVITPEGTEVQTLYALSTCKSLDEAILNLAVREDSGRKSIGYYEKETTIISPKNFVHLEKLTNWLSIKPEIDAIIWTNLKDNWQNTSRIISHGYSGSNCASDFGRLVPPISVQTVPL